MRIEKNGAAYKLLLQQTSLEECGFSEEDELVLIPLAKGVCLLTTSEKAREITKKQPEEKKEAVSEEEILVLRKLDKFKFEERIPYTVRKSLSKKEISVLESLIKRGLVEVYKGGKYQRTGVYNISSKIYSLVHKKTASYPVSSVEHLEEKGFMIVDNEGEAKRVSTVLSKQIKAGEVIGTRGFDKKFYVAKSSLYMSLSESFREILRKEPSDARSIAEKARVEEELAHTILELMSDKGEVIEKKKGNYVLC